MCVGGGGSNDAAKDARKAEKKRQKQITEGTEAINQQFARFDEPFFQGVEQAALNFFVPQLEDQFTDAKDATIKRLAREGNLEASAGLNQLGDLTDAANFNRLLVADKARGLANQQRSNVEQDRSRLLSQLHATTDPAAAAASATIAARALTAPPEFSPLGDLFSQFADDARVQILSAKGGFQNSVSPLFPANSRGFTTVST